MQIQQVQNQKFNGWVRGAENRLRCYFLRESNSVSSIGVDKLLSKIEKNSTDFLVDFDATFSIPRFTIEPKKNPLNGKKIFVAPDIFHRSVLSCMRQVNSIVQNEGKTKTKLISETISGVMSKVTDSFIEKIKLKKQPKSILDMDFGDLPLSPLQKLDGAIPPIKIPDFSKSKSLIQPKSLQQNK